jgi:small subunit ribosomal protein S15
MPLLKERKTEVITQFRKHEKDTGSSEVQVAIITERINQLKSHFDMHKKDHHSRYGLLLLVARRKRLLNYLKNTSPNKYREVIDSLGLRK